MGSYYEASSKAERAYHLIMLENFDSKGHFYVSQQTMHSDAGSSFDSPSY
jgi:heat shock protein HspQ